MRDRSVTRPHLRETVSGNTTGTTRPRGTAARTDPSPSAATARIALPAAAAARIAVGPQQQSENVQVRKPPGDAFGKGNPQTSGKKRRRFDAGEARRPSQRRQRLGCACACADCTRCVRVQWWHGHVAPCPGGQRRGDGVPTPQRSAAPAGPAPDEGENMRARDDVSVQACT